MYKRWFFLSKSHEPQPFGIISSFPLLPSLSLCRKPIINGRWDRRPPDQQGQCGPFLRPAWAAMFFSGYCFTRYVDWLLYVWGGKGRGKGWGIDRRDCAVYIFFLFFSFFLFPGFWFFLPPRKEEGEEWSGGKKKNVCLERTGRTQRYSGNFIKYRHNMALFSRLKKSFFNFLHFAVLQYSGVACPMLRTYGEGRAWRNAGAVLMPPVPPSLPPRPINHS